MSSVKAVVDQRGRSMNIFALGTSQNVSYQASSGAAASSAAFGDYTYAIQIAVKSGYVRVKIGNAPTADGNSTLLLGPGIFIYMASPGGKVSVISDDTNIGAINVTEIVGNSSGGLNA